MSSPVSPENVRGQLERILGSKAFAPSARSANLLRFIVEESLSGRAGELKEYTLGALALEKGDSFDPRTDPIVRAEASRLRNRLELYYAAEGQSDPVVIDLPKGGYVPAFTVRGQDRKLIGPPRRRLAMALWSLALIGASAAWALWPSTRPLSPLRRFEIELRSDGTLGATVSPDIAISPDGSRVAFIAQDQNAVASLYLLQWDQGSPVRLEGTEGARSPFFSPNGEWIAFQADGKLRKVAVSGGTPAILCDAADIQGGSWGEDGYIYATLGQVGTFWKVRQDGGSPTKVLDIAPSVAAWPQVLPGSSAVLFTNMRGGPEGPTVEVASLHSGNRKVVARGIYGRYLANGYLTYIDGGRLFAVHSDAQRQSPSGDAVAMLDDVAYSPTFGYGHLAISRNGMLIYRRGSGLLTIDWLDSMGNRSPIIGKPGRYLNPRLSPDGKQMAYATSDPAGLRMWILNMETKTTTRLDSGDTSYGQPMWTPDKRFILMSGRLGLVWMPADGSRSPAPLLPGKVIQVPASMTPDGKTLVFLQFDPGPDLWTVPVFSDSGQLRAGKPEPFQATTALESQARFSPNGRWIAYNSTMSGSWEVYVQSFPPSGKAVQVSAGGGRIPFWSSTSNELFYATERQKIMVVPYDMRGGVFSASAPRPWTERKFADTGVLAGVDLAPDGKRFVALMAAEPLEEQQSPNHVTLLQNFFDEIERRVRK